MIRSLPWLAASLLLVACPPRQPTPVPDAGGGFVSTGGSPATGGNLATGGSIATGGALAVRFPPCVTQGFKAAPATRHTLGALLQVGAMRLSAVTIDPVYDLSDVFRQVNDRDPGDQDGKGACTGFDAMHVVCTDPFVRHVSDADGFAIYSAATKLDLGCAFNAKSCPGSYPPADPGSYGTSAMQALIELAYVPKLSSFIVAGNYETGVTRLHKSACMYERYWTDSMFVYDSCGLITVKGKAVGGHSTVWVGHDSARHLDWFRNSWTNSPGNPWGIPDAAGKRGFFAQTEADTRALFSQGGAIVCPVVP